MVTNKNLGNVVAKNVAKSNARRTFTVSYVMAATTPVAPAKTDDDLFEDPAWQAALEAEVLARHNNGGQPL